MVHKIPNNGNVIITGNSYSGGSRNFDRRQRVQVKSKKGHQLYQSFLKHRNRFSHYHNFYINTLSTIQGNFCSSYYQLSLIRGVHSFRGSCTWNHCNPTVSAPEFYYSITQQTFPSVMLYACYAICMLCSKEYMSFKASTS